MPKTLRACARGIKMRVLFFIMTIAISGVSFSRNIKTTENLNIGLPIVAWDFPMQMNGILGYPNLQEHGSGIRIKQRLNPPPLCNPCTIFNPALGFQFLPKHLRMTAALFPEQPGGLNLNHLQTVILPVYGFGKLLRIQSIHLSETHLIIPFNYGRWTDPYWLRHN